MKIVPPLVACLFILLSLAGFVHASGITAIHEINTSPANFDGKTVTLKGVTKDPTRIPVIDLKAYVLEDISGELIILTGSDLPRMGVEITVRVHIENLAIIKGEALGTTVVELQRYE
ncbi:MAG TPA: hypothetical protein PKM20_06540 [Nitrosomonas sp.]|nr:hypothetical protein [Nitrosomonas sp.]HNP26378.1 hypothetical protein [Nitrosomonas sp.]